jgi:hypothetical protein
MFSGLRQLGKSKERRKFCELQEGKTGRKKLREIKSKRK